MLGRVVQSMLPAYPPGRFIPDVVINCAGMVKSREEASYKFVAANSLLPHNLAYDSIRVIQVSSDCVFDGNHSAPYSEDVLPAPADLYGRSKLAGEIYDPPHLTVRTSFVGVGKRGLLRDMMGRRGQTIKVKKFSYWTGHTTIAIARILLQLADKDVSGVLHIPGEVIRRADLVRKLSKAFNLNIKVEETSDIGLDRRLVSNRWNELELPAFMTLDEEIDELAEAYKNDSSH